MSYMIPHRSCRRVDHLAGGAAFVGSLLIISGGWRGSTCNGHSAHDRARCGDAWCVADGEIKFEKKGHGRRVLLFINPASQYIDGSNARTDSANG